MIYSYINRFALWMPLLRYNTTEIIICDPIKFNILLEHLGDLDTEQFISTLLKESFDYTEWRRKHLAEYDMNPAEFNRAVTDFVIDRGEEDEYGILRRVVQLVVRPVALAAGA